MITLSNSLGCERAGCPNKSRRPNVHHVRLRALPRANRRLPTAHTPNRSATSSTIARRFFVPWPPWQCFFLGASPDARTGDASRHDQEWKRYIDDNSIRWPIGSRALGNEGIGGVVRETAGSIGYVELGYASKQGLTMGLVRNPAGKFVKASSESVAAASKREVTYLAECMHLATSEVCTRLPYIQLPSDAYAITGDIWLVFSKNPANKTKALSTLDFAKWFLLESKGSKTNWTPLPKEIASESLAAIDEQRIHLSNTKKETSQKSATPIATLEHKSVGVGVDGKPALSP